MGTSNPKRSPQPTRVRCSGCNRTIAWTDGLLPLRNKVFCSLWCAAEPAVTKNSPVIDQWDFLKRAGFSPVAIAKRYGVAHSQVYNCLDRLREIP